MNPPEVSIVIPCLNEEKTIIGLLDSILHQTYPLDRLEVIIADGGSTDKTLQLIDDFQNLHPELSIRQVENPMRTIPAGLNRAIRAARGRIITRMDAHTLPIPEYVERSVTLLLAGKGDNVGGVIDIHPGGERWIARGIAIATAHPLGVGDAKYRWTTQAGEADTVAFGTYFKSKVEEIGYYNEALRINEDYEFNVRLRASGGKIWIDPKIRAVYYSRPDLSALGRQYFFYGFWKLRMLRDNPTTLRWRQALPPLFIFCLLMLLLLSVFSRIAAVLLVCILWFYLATLLTEAIRISIRKRDATLVAGIPIAIMTMHFCWGSGFWWSILSRKEMGN